ncbi:hypothetical protein [uncultured Pseudokineococcus sp.]|uniref:hypothetical protein n=1 Tax=uncultured Pseudokineococcus sp. TaxID=1642928 RepID=UPI00261A83B7|nr:hypothetical protein [uncultured Pseudokineococcus sp.]
MREVFTTAAAVIALALAPSAALAATPTASVLGGKVIANGRSAQVEFQLTCPKGERWYGESGVYAVPDEVPVLDPDQAPEYFIPAFGRASGTCTGKAQKVKIKVDTPGSGSGFPETLPTNCNATHDARFIGDSFRIVVSGSSDGGPRLCLR